jgi:hypothetical protein
MAGRPVDGAERDELLQPGQTVSTTDAFANAR